MEYKNGVPQIQFDPAAGLTHTSQTIVEKPIQPALTPERAEKQVATGEQDVEVAEATEDTTEEASQEAQPTEEVESAESEEGEEENKQPTSSDYAKILRKQRELDDRLNSLADKEKTVEDRLKLIERIKTDPIGALGELGIDYEEVVTRVASEGDEEDLSDVEILQRKIDGLNKKIADKEKQEEEQRTKAQQERDKQIIQNHKIAIGNTISAEAEKYPILNSTPGAVEMVFGVIQDHFNENGAAPSIEDALKFTETDLTRQLKTYLKDPKVRELLVGVSEKSSEQTEVTLTSQQTGSSTSKVESANLTDAERLARGAALLQFN